jgi:hypothetical protein
MDTKPENASIKTCSRCEETKTFDKFYAIGTICRDCKNGKRREKYKNDETHRKQLIKTASDFKHKKVVERQMLRTLEQQEIGLENKQCKYCSEIKSRDKFRYNRLKCRDCERDEPTEKFKRYIRTRIYNCLRNKNKSFHAIDYLGCSSDEYFKWIFSYNDSFVLQNHGKVWHIDHVIPISKFDLNDEMQQLIAFNWRNTMPLYSRDNLSKNNKIIQEQIENHYKKIVEYHLENKLDLPQVYINLFAKYLVAGSPLEPILSNK